MSKYVPPHLRVTAPVQAPAAVNSSTYFKNRLAELAATGIPTEFNVPDLSLRADIYKTFPVTVVEIDKNKKYSIEWHNMKLKSNPNPEMYKKIQEYQLLSSILNNYSNIYALEPPTKAGQIAILHMVTRGNNTRKFNIGNKKNNTRKNNTRKNNIGNKKNNTRKNNTQSVKTFKMLKNEAGPSPGIVTMSWTKEYDQEFINKLNKYRIGEAPPPNPSLLFTDDEIFGQNIMLVEGMAHNELVNRQKSIDAYKRWWTAYGIDLTKAWNKEHGIVDTAELKAKRNAKRAETLAAAIAAAKAQANAEAKARKNAAEARKKAAKNIEASGKSGW
jgi:hypothetical protein